MAGAVQRSLHRPMVSKQLPKPAKVLSADAAPISAA